MSSVADFVASCRAGWRRVVHSVSRAKYDRALAEELAAHIALHTDDNVRQGMGPSAARRHAVLALGGFTQTMERCADVTTLPWLSRLVWRSSAVLRRRRSSSV